MARRRASSRSSSTSDGAAGQENGVQDYRYDTKRKNNPPAGLAAQGRIRETPKLQFAYDPHRPPALRFDQTGAPDALPDLLRAARTRSLTEDEAQTLAEALRNHEPWLEWAGKREHKRFEVDPVALHIHERISTQAILKVAAREPIQRSFFADPEQEYHEAVRFYEYDVDWANRMILGDSLQVMASLARREDLAGKVQMVYMDPPYGIKFASNFQAEIGKRDVKDKESDLTREPEMVKAYRDTWTLGVHSYLTYLRDRLYMAKELLADTGSIFVQIGAENVHFVRNVLDEVFESNNFCSQIAIKKTGAQTTKLLPPVCDYLLWYAKNLDIVKYRQVFKTMTPGEGHSTGERYDQLLLPDGCAVPAGTIDTTPDDSRFFRSVTLSSNRPAKEHEKLPLEFHGRTFLPPMNRTWSTTPKGFHRLVNAERIHAGRDSLNYVKFLDDFPANPLGNFWEDLPGSPDKVYVVQTNAKIIQRCIHMTTDPGDLVLDPTCGSGTTAYVAEQWGRRWITIDTSRVALAIARQRLLTATFPMYRVRSDAASAAEEDASFAKANPSNGFVYETVPHITLKSIAQNTALDEIFAAHQPRLDVALAALNAALARVTPETRAKLLAKLAAKERQEGRRSITDADRRRWVLPKEAWKVWEVPFDADPDWPQDLQEALTTYRAAWRAKMHEVDACIAANAEQEELVDRPEVVKGVVRVSGPFTMEAVMPAEESLDAMFDGAPEALETFGDHTSTNGAVHGDGSVSVTPAVEPANAEAYLEKMLRLLRADGMRFPNNRVVQFTRLDPYLGAGDIHAEGDWPPEHDGAEPRRVAVSFGPQYGPVTALQVEQALRQAARRGFDDLVLAGFSFDGAAQAAIQDDPNPVVRCHLAHIRPDVAMEGLLKETPNSQIFTVFGSPRTELQRTADGQFVVEMQGVDIYNPVDNTIAPTSADKVAAWFLDGDYDGRTFCITQAFFPDKSAWDKLERALKGKMDEDRFASLTGTKSLPFPAGKHRRAAVKAIDPRGNEVMRVHTLDEATVPA